MDFKTHLKPHGALVVRTQLKGENIALSAARKGLRSGILCQPNAR